jgi:hypothetical protein
VAGTPPEQQINRFCLNWGTFFRICDFVGLNSSSLPLFSPVAAPISALLTTITPGTYSRAVASLLLSFPAVTCTVIEIFADFDAVSVEIQGAASEISEKSLFKYLFYK